MKIGFEKLDMVCCLYTRSQVSVREKLFLSVLMAVICFCFHFS